MNSIARAATWVAAMMSVGVAAANETQPVGQFSFTLQAELPGDVDFAYGLVTGDVSEWWDHTFSEAPARLYVDARPGGGFYEIFDDAGNGVEHARVIFAQPGKKLTMVGPLGFNGYATEIVFSYGFEKSPGGTTLTLTVNGSGQLQEGWAGSVEAVWRHFIFDQLVPYARKRCVAQGCE